PDLPLAWYMRGLAHAARHDFAAAIADYDRAIDLEPRFLGAYQARGQARTLLADYERALADHIEAIRQNPRSAAGFNKFAWLWITWPEVQLRDATMGIELATRACELSLWDD